jgi:hypothetical protein
VDKNQPEIVSAFRKCGFMVLHLHTIGSGCPDLLIARRKINTLVEVKDGSLPPSARKLTPDEQKFFDTWPGEVVIVESVDDVLELSDRLP